MQNLNQRNRKLFAQVPCVVCVVGWFSNKAEIVVGYAVWSMQGQKIKGKTSCCVWHKKTMRRSGCRLENRLRTSCFQRWLLRTFAASLFFRRCDDHHTPNISHHEWPRRWLTQRRMNARLAPLPTHAHKCELIAADLSACENCVSCRGSSSSSSNMYASQPLAVYHPATEWVVVFRVIACAFGAQTGDNHSITFFFLCSNASECIISTRFGRVIWRRCPSSCRTENATHDDLNSEAVVCCRMNDHVVQCASVFQLKPASLCSAGARHFACTKGYNLTHMCRRVYMAAYSFHLHQLCVSKLS